MRPSDGKIRFGEWLPDQPALDNPGLTEAENVLYIDNAYQPFKPLQASGGMTALASEPLGGLVTQSYTYVGLTTSIQRSFTSLGTWTDVSKATYTTSEAWYFDRFDEYVIATNFHDVPQRQVLGTGDFVDLASTGTAPNAQTLGKIGRFLVLGATDDSTNGEVLYRIQWPAIDDITDWPVPGSADALSKQAGQQFLNPEWGAVKAIVGGDQFGIIMQHGGLTRATYVGGNVVFQFDEISNAGIFFPASVVYANGLWYYISQSGFMVTDGVTAVPIGAGKVDRYFWDSYWAPNVARVRGAVDTNRKMIFWSYPDETGSKASRIIAYNYESKRFTTCLQDSNCLLSDPEALPSTSLSFRAFDTSHVGKKFTANAGVAKLTTGEYQFHPGARTYVQGIKPLVSWPTGVTVNETVAIGARDDQDDDSLTYTSESTPHSRTGFAGFRSDAEYHRARVTLTGNFDKAMGLEFQQVESGST